MKRLPTLFLIVCSFLVFTAQGQSTPLVPGFEADVLEGCSPLTVNFNDTSSGPIVFRKWIFGNGNNASGNSNNVGATYSNPGQYTVTLIISDGFDTVSLTKTQYINVSDSPLALFTSSSSGPNCAPKTFSFNDLSIPGGAPIASYSWDFGDGSPPATTQNASHTYTYPGSFNVTLFVTDTVGCVGAKTNSNQATINPNPVAAFQALPSNVRCQPPLSVNFLNNSTGASPLTYFWDYDLGTSTNTAPSAIYSNTGTHDVSLIVTDANGCADTTVESNYIAIGAMAADFTFPNPTCRGAFTQFTNTSSGGFNFQWDFGNGQTSTAEDPSIVYNTPGTYTVTLSISAPSGNCSDSVSYQISVVDMTPDFTADTLYSCELPFDVSYTDNTITTGNITSQLWEFGNNDQSTAVSPTYTYTDSGGYYDITYTVTDDLGCEGTITKPAYVFIEIPTLGFQIVETDGCTPRQIQFNNTSTPMSSFSS